MSESGAGLLVHAMQHRPWTSRSWIITGVWCCWRRHFKQVKPRLAWTKRPTSDNCHRLDVLGLGRSCRDLSRLAAGTSDTAISPRDVRESLAPEIGDSLSPCLSGAYNWKRRANTFFWDYSRNVHTGLTLRDFHHSSDRLLSTESLTRHLPSFIHPP